MQNLRELTDTQIVNALHISVAKANAALARLLVALGEFDARSLSARTAHATTHRYCVQRLGMSGDQAFRRVAAARVARDYPIVVAMVERGEIHLSAIEELRLFLTPDNHVELLRSAAGKSKREVRRLVHEKFLGRDVESRIKMTFLATRALEEKIAYVTSLLRHSNPSGDLAAVVEAAIDALVAKLEKERLKKGKARRE